MHLPHYSFFFSLDYADKRNYFEQYRAVALPKERQSSTSFPLKIKPTSQEALEEEKKSGEAKAA
jgi:hypothetical protein